MIPDEFDHLTKDILQSLSVKNPELLGKGDQGWVFRYKAGTVVKIYRKAKKEYLESLSNLEKRIAEYKLPFEVTEIYEINNKDDVYFTFEKELSGKSLGKIFPILSERYKEKTATEFIDAIKYLSSVTFEDRDFGQILITGEQMSALSWSEFLDKKLSQRISLVNGQLEKDVFKLDGKIELLRQVFKELVFDQKKLVHGDYFYNNVLFDEKNNLSAVLDFSNSTVVGDYRMDIACAIMYFDIDEKWKNFITELAVKNYGEGILPIIKFYTAYQAFFQAESCLYNSGLYKWCLSQLNSEDLWNFIKSSL